MQPVVVVVQADPVENRATKDKVPSIMVTAARVQHQMY
jgi:hypothetical protein